MIQVGWIPSSVLEGWKNLVCPGQGNIWLTLNFHPLTDQNWKCNLSSECIVIGYCSKVLLWHKNSIPMCANEKKNYWIYLATLVSRRYCFSIRFWQGCFFSVCGKNSPWAIILTGQCEVNPLGQSKLLGKSLIEKCQGGL